MSVAWQEAIAALGGTWGRTVHSLSWPGNEITLSVMAHTKVLSYNLFPLLRTHSWDWVAWGRWEDQVHPRKLLCYLGTLLWPIFLLSAYRLCLASTWSRSELWMDQMKVYVIFPCWKTSALLVTVCGEKHRRMQWAVLKMQLLLLYELHTQKTDLSLLQCSEGRNTQRCRMWTFWTNLTVSSVRRWKCKETLELEKQPVASKSAAFQCLTFLRQSSL